MFPIIKKRRLERLLLVLSEVVVGIVSNLVVFKVLFVFFLFVVVVVVAMHVLLFSLVMGLWIKKINFCDFGYCFVNRCKATFVCF